MSATLNTPRRQHLPDRRTSGVWRNLENEPRSGWKVSITDSEVTIMKVLKRTGSLTKDKAAKQKQERKRRSLGGLFLSPEHIQ